MAFWSTKSAISLKCGHIEEKLLWGAYRNLLTFFQTAPSSTPCGLPFPKIGVRPPPKTPIAIISGTGKATNFKFGQNNNRVHPNKMPLKRLEKRERGSIQGLPNFFGYPLLSQQREKLLISNLAITFRGSIRIKAHEKFWRKGSVGVSRDCPNFLCILYYLRNGKSCGLQIWLVHSEGPSEQKSIKILEKSERGRILGLPNFFGYPQLSQERVKL